MKRAGRWLFNFAAAVSVVLCIAVLALGIRSFWKVESLAIDHRSGTCFWVEVERGRLAVWRRRRLAPPTPPAPLLVIRVAPPSEPERPQVRMLGEDLTSGRPNNLITESVLGFGRKSLPQAPFDKAVANIAGMRKRADQMRASYPSISQSFQGEADAISAKRHTEWQVCAPMWAPLLCLIWIPCLFVAKKRKLYKRKRLGQCLACGYDLRATPDRCPECGAVPPTAKGAAA